MTIFVKKNKCKTGIWF